MTAPQKYLLWAVLFLGFTLRVTAVQFGLPYLYHADEPIIVNHALAYGAGDLNPHFFKIPPLVSYLLFFCYGAFFMLGKISGAFSNAAQFETFFYNDPSVFYLIARLIFGALAGTAALAAFYAVLKPRFSARTALAGAFLLSVCFLHVRDSHYIYADIPLNLVMIAAFGAFFCLRQEPSLKRHLISGVLIGLAAALKYNGAALMLPYLAASLLSPRKFDFRGWAAAALASVLVFIVLNPFAILDFKFFVSELEAQSGSQGGTPWSHHLTYSLTGGLGLPMLAAGLAGLFTAFKGRPEHKILAVFTIGYYLVLVKAGQPYDRYAIPLLPALVFFAADFTDRVARGKIPFLVWILIMAAPNLAKSVLFDKIMLAEDIRTVAKKWVEQNIPENSTMALDWDFYMPRLAFSKTQLEKKKAKASVTQKRKLDFLLTHERKKTYQLYFMIVEDGGERFLFAEPVVPYKISALVDHGADYAIILGIPQKPGLTEFFFRDIRATGHPIAKFTPYKSGRMKPYDIQPLTGGPFTWPELLDRERNGLPIEIYKIGK